MKIKNSDLPAMPNNNPETYPTPCCLCYGNGLTKREMFAMEVMKAMISNTEVFGVGDLDNSNFHKSIKSSCYSIADTMLEEL